MNDMTPSLPQTSSASTFGGTPANKSWAARIDKVVWGMAAIFAGLAVLAPAQIPESLKFTAWALVGISPGNSLGPTRLVNIDHGFVTSYLRGGICEVFAGSSTVDLSVSSDYRNSVHFLKQGSRYRLTVDFQ